MHYRNSWRASQSMLSLCQDAFSQSQIPVGKILDLHKAMLLKSCPFKRIADRVTQPGCALHLAIDGSILLLFPVNLSCYLLRSSPPSKQDGQSPTLSIDGLTRAGPWSTSLAMLNARNLLQVLWDFTKREIPHTKVPEPRVTSCQLALYFLHACTCGLGARS